MRIALTGASGFIGSFIAAELARRGHTVTALVREHSRRDHIEDLVDRFVVGDHADESAWSAFLEGADAVVHNSLDWAPLKAKDFDAHLRSNVVAALRLLHLSAPRRFVFMSTIAVHHDMRPRWGGTIDEDHPTRPANWYGAAKATVEAHLFAAHHGEGRHAAAIRPCAVYGMDPTLSRSIGEPMIRSMRAGEPHRRLGGGKFVHVEDVAIATVSALERPEASGQVYNLVDCYARWSDWAHVAADILGLDDAEIDDSSPAKPKNTFVPDAAQSLGARLDRGMDGIRVHLAELIAKMERVV